MQQQRRWTGTLHRGYPPRLGPFVGEGSDRDTNGEPRAERAGRAKRMVKVTATGARAAADLCKMISVASRDVQWPAISR